MPGFENELRLALTLVLNVGVFASAYRFARRRGSGGILQAACDAFLVYIVVQYAAVALPGVAGVFNVWTMSLVAAAAAVLLWIGGGRGPAVSERPPLSRDHFGLIACDVFLVAYLTVYIFDQRANPPTATDALVYHLPTAVQWLQTGSLGLFPTWYWNPAATYSPATSSTFMAWLMAPPGNDVFVRFVQAPALVFIFLLVARLARDLGCSRTVAGLVALAAAMSRPFLSEAIIPKDDLFITAFFGAAVLSLTPTNLRDRLGPWRVGLSFGMVLASKYTVLLACPLFLFMLDAPLRATWRPKHWAIALGVGAVLFAPWYLRNIILTGNPLYPVDVKPFGIHLFTGLFGTERDQQLRTAGGVWKMLGQTYHSLPPVLVGAIVIGWIGGLVAAKRSMLRDPLRRACLIGSVATFVLFVVTSPHHEVRYMFPLFLLMFAVAGYAIASWLKPEPVRIAAGAILAVASIATAFNVVLASQTRSLLLQAAIMTVIVTAGVIVQTHWLKFRPAVLAGFAIVVVALPAYVFWSSFLDTYYRKTSDGVGEAGISFAWRQTYSPEEPLWSFVRENVPDDATIAIANTYFVYPFQDARFQRRLGYAPVRRGLHDFQEFPYMGDKVPGDLIVQRMTDVMNEDPDKATWLENLQRMKAAYLVIATFPHEDDPPEGRFVREEANRFEQIFAHPTAGAVYRVR